MSLEGKVAVVTGGSRGIGRAICLRLSAMGALVYVNFVSRPGAAEETRDMVVEAGGRAEIVGFDVADSEAVQGALKKIIKEAGSIDILINNAGITKDGLTAMMKEPDWDMVLDTNLKGSFLCAKAAFRSMMKKKWGRIVNISSVSGATGQAGQANYSAAKAGMFGLTKALAREFASRNITVNCVAPGYIATEMTEVLDDAIKEKIKEEIPLASFGSPADIAGAVAYLVSEDGGYVTGQTIHVNGGMYM